MPWASARAHGRQDITRAVSLQRILSGASSPGRMKGGKCSACEKFYPTGAFKEAMIAGDHVKGLEAPIFMGMKSHGKGFERYYERAKDLGIQFRRCRVHSLEPVPESDNIYLRHLDNQGRQIEDECDMVVLSAGLRTPPESVEHDCRADVAHHRTFRDSPAPARAGGAQGGGEPPPILSLHDIPAATSPRHPRADGPRCPWRRRWRRPSW